MAHRVTLIPGDGTGPELGLYACVRPCKSYLGERDAARRLEAAVAAVIAEGKHVT